METTDQAPAKSRRTGPLVSSTGQVLVRPVTFQFALDPTVDQRVLFAKSAGARRVAFNHHVGRVKENLDRREREKDLPYGPRLPGLSWSAISFINEMNAWKNGQLDSSPQNDDGTRGLHWRHEIPSDVFECASVDAAQALANWSDSKRGTRKGVPVGFPRFAAKGRVTPSFRLRNRANPGETQSIRFTDPTHLRLPKIGEVKVFGPTRRVRRMIGLGRFHIHSATITLRGGRWICSLNGVAAKFHHERRRPKDRHATTVGIDRGITALAVCADAQGQLLAVFEGVNELRHAHEQLVRAQKTLARATPGSKGRSRAKSRLNKLHRRVANQRRHHAHQVSSWVMKNCGSVVLEDLNVAGMVKNHHLARAISDAAMGEVGRQIHYKAPWYGVNVTVADRFFASSKICSGCGAKKDRLDLSTRVYACEHCDLVIDRDHNAGVNLARWTPALVST
ncbi:MAG: IS200/IS605 family element transposase accessory protein TnpB [Acidimicrobiaceae bacterium]|nr:IS200/IS605 family element transposase accessory protein TnpB [Acidimicrobiaceae bacterium]